MDARDVRWSLNRLVAFIAAQESLPGVTLPTMSSTPQVRPAFVVQSLPGGTNERVTKGLTLTSMRFNIMYATIDYDAAELFIVAMERYLQNHHWKFPGILYNFRYPSPNVYGRSDVGSLTPGPYYVAVTGLNHLDASEETHASRPQLVTLSGAQDTVRIVIPRHPGLFNWFSQYNIYAGASPTTMKKTADSPVAAHPYLTSVYDLEEVPLAGDAPPTAESKIQYRYLEVMLESYSGNVIRDTGMEGSDYIGMISMVLRAPLTAVVPQGEPIGSVDFQVFAEPTALIGRASLVMTMYPPIVTVA